jgi:hypothetical protein
MLDFLRNRGRSEQDRRQEMLNAYLDGELTPVERDRFEQQLAQNSDLRDELADMQFWQQQMRDLPPRRVPRNFTLDPTLYGPPQRQVWGNAFPALRAATALTAFLLVIALAANVYMSSFSTGAVSQAVMAPAFESATMQAAEVEESAPLEIAPEGGAVAPEEEFPVETEMAAEEEVLPEMSAAPLATPFALETSIDKESEAAEAPIEIAGAEETVPAEGAAEESVEELQFSEQEEPLTEELKEELAQSLDIVEETSEPPLADAREAVPTMADEIIIAEEAVVDEVTPAAKLPEAGGELSSTQPPAPVDETSSASNISLSLGLEEISIALGLLLISLAILTLIAYRRR